MPKVVKPSELARFPREDLKKLLKFLYDLARVLGTEYYEVTVGQLIDALEMV